MGEGLPENQDPNLLPADRQPIEATSSESIEQAPITPEDNTPPSDGTTEPTHLTATDHGDDTGRWDEQKASTLAPVVQEQFMDEFRNMGDARDKIKQLEHNPDFEDDKTTEASRTMVEDGMVASYNNDEDSVERAAQSKHRYESVEADQAHRIHEKLEAAHDMVDGLLLEHIQPFDGLYDINPKAFADMPTHEFMRIGYEYAGLCHNVRMREQLLYGSEDTGPGLQGEYEALMQDVANGKSPTHEEIYGLMENFWNAFAPIDDENESYSERMGPEYSEMVEQVMSILDGPLDKSKREMVQSLSGIVDGWMAQFKEVLEMEQRAKEVFIAQYRPESSENSS